MIIGKVVKVLFYNAAVSRNKVKGTVKANPKTTMPHTMQYVTSKG